MPLSYIESFPVIVTRRTPVSARPPANYRLAYSNGYYDGWVRTSSPRVLSQVSLQAVAVDDAPWQGSSVEPCSSLRSIAAGAPSGGELVAALAPPASGFAPLSAPGRPLAWGIDVNPYGAVTTIGPGFVQERVAVARSGLYAAWVQGSFPRPVAVLVDGRSVGSVSGFDSRDQWSEAGTIRLGAGFHELAIHRGGGRIDPGDGSRLGEIGYVSLQPVGSVTLRTVSRARWRLLCGANAQWIDVVKP